MKPRVFSTFLILFLTISAFSQVPETYYQGSVARSGFIDQASYGPFNIGFNFNFFENTYTEFYVSSNGLVTFGAGSASATEQPIPTATIPNNFIAPFWTTSLSQPPVTYFIQQSARSQTGNLSSSSETWVSTHLRHTWEPLL